MPSQTVHELIIPSCSGKAIKVNKGQTFRVIENEGKQVASLIMLNACNYKEQLMAEFSGAALNSIAGVGTFYKPVKLYSKVPYENLMASFTYDSVNQHFLGPHCTKRMMMMLNAVGHRSCSDNFADGLAEIGLELKDVYSPSVVNLFMNARIDTKGDGALIIDPPCSSKGDYVDLLAEMDIVIVLSACPDDITPTNDFSCKSLKVQVLD